MRKRPDRRPLSAVLVALLALTVLATAAMRLGIFSFPGEGSSEARAWVARVVDGDTIRVTFGGREYTVRYIGVDTPETVDPRRPVQPFGKEASARNKELVEGKTVRLEKDVSETDRFGRLLRYVYVDDLMVNAILVQEGYAHAVSYPPDVKHQELFRRLEREAREAKRGLWGLQ